jgi:hypothetical protein
VMSYADRLRAAGIDPALIEQYVRIDDYVKLEIAEQYMAETKTYAEEAKS